MIYDMIAGFYDDYTRDQLSHASAAVAQQELHRYGIEAPATVLDLACGTGLITELMHGYGFSVTGVDISEGMLRVARQRCPEGPRWQLADILEYESDRGFSAILCFGDVLNHFVEPARVLLLLERAYSLLAPGGVFLADTNTLDTYRSELWNEGDTFTVEEDLDVEMDAWYDAEQGLAHLRATGTRGEILVYNETLRERHYSTQEVHGWLETAGFREVCCRVYNPIPDLEKIATQKHLWVARKWGPG